MKRFTPDDAKGFYDRFGSKQDLQAFYENRAITDLIAHADFEHARSVFELGFGTGKPVRFATCGHSCAECKAGEARLWHCEQ